MNNYKPILLIENNREDAKFIELALNDLHVINNLEHKINIDEAYEYLRDKNKPKPCVILLDLNMPNMSALEFIKTLKTDQTLKQLPIIALISSETNIDITQISELDIAGHILKPFDYKQFIEAIKALNIQWALNEK
ncbi:MAG: response regulator [Sedimentisphaerales bacterium]|nr:response regulator [Sedimentisphaerales bacterium]